MISKKVLFVGLLALIWGGNFPTSRFLLNSMDVLSVRFISSIISLCVYSVLFFPYIKKLRHIERGEIKTILLLSLPSVFLVPLLNLYALSYLESASALLLIYTMPAMTSFILLLGKKSKFSKELIPVVFSVIGVLFVIGFPMDLSTGEAIILLSALVWAAGGLLNQKYMPSIPLIEISFIQLFFVSLCNIATLLFFAEPQWSVLATLNLSTYLALFYVGVIAGGLAFYLWFELIKAYGAPVAAYCTLWAPIVGLIIIAMVTEEKISLNLLIGAGFIIFSIYAKNTLSKKSLKRQLEKVHDQITDARR